MTDIYVSCLYLKDLASYNKTTRVVFSNKSSIK